MAGALDRILRDFKLCSVSVEDNPLEISVSRVRNGILDFAIGNADADVSLSDFTVEHLMDCPFVIVCKRGHPLENSTRLEQLRNANWWVTGEFNVCQRKYPLFNDMSLRQSLHTRSHIVGLPMVFNFFFPCATLLRSSEKIQGVFVSGSNKRFKCNRALFPDLSKKCTPK